MTNLQHLLSGIGILMIDAIVAYLTNLLISNFHKLNEVNKFVASVLIVWLAMIVVVFTVFGFSHFAVGLFEITGDIFSSAWINN